MMRRMPDPDALAALDVDLRDAGRPRRPGARPADRCRRPPIYQTSTYRQEGVGRPTGGYEYARTQNPIRERLERAVAALEGGRHGIAFASGSATTAAIAELVAPGEEVVVGDDVYGGTYRYLTRVAGMRGVIASYVDLASGPDVLWEALSERTALVWFETPTNPLPQGHRHRGDRPGPSRERAAEARSTTARRRRQHVRDADHSSARCHSARTSSSTPRRSTSPATPTPSLGVAVTTDDAVAERLRFLQNAMGARPGPVRLLPRPSRPADSPPADRAPRGERGGGRRVPRGPRRRRDGRTRGLADGPHAHPGAAIVLARFVPAAGWSRSSRARTADDRAAPRPQATRIFTLAESLGGVESLDGAPGDDDPRLRRRHPSRGRSEALVRLSVGIEAAADLIADLARPSTRPDRVPTCAGRRSFRGRSPTPGAWRRRRHLGQR